MKLYEKIEDILSLAAEFHARLGRFYEDLTDEVKKEEVAQLLDYLSRHEKQLNEGLQKYRTEDREKTSETRLQYVPRDEQLSLEDLEPSPDWTMDDLIEFVKVMKNRLLSFYREVADSASLPPEVKEIFVGLVEQEKQEKTKLVRTADQIKNT